VLPLLFFCCGQILNWSAAAPAKQRQSVSIEVPVGQQEVGRLLLCCMYQQQIDLSSTEQQVTLLLLLVLADKYAVPAAVAAVSRAFKDTPFGQLQWDTVVATYQLPAVYIDNTAFAQVYNAAADALQHTLGDLELVFATDCEDNKLQLLVELPYAGLLQLLADERTHVSSENTAARAVLEWLEDSSEDVSNEQLKQLVSAPATARITTRTTSP
jgi:hypothetical protein